MENFCCFIWYIGKLLLPLRFKLNITVHQFQVDEGEIYEKEWFENKDLPGINRQTFKIILDEK